MFKKQLTLLACVIAVLLITLGSCKSKYEKLKASNDNAKKYSEAIKLYNKREYTKALGLFDDLVTRYRGHEGAEDLFYYNAYANYKLKDYTAAGYHFKSFADTYPSSPRAEECRFMYAYCLYLDSPIYSLDQANTSKAIDGLQLFINLYPKSDRVAEASKLIQTLRDKLESKAYANAKLYLTIGDFQAAVIAFGNTLRDYPDTKYAEELEYLTIEAQYKYAKNSRVDFQEDRYTLAITWADQFTEKYPTSRFLKETAVYKKYSQDEMAQSKRLLAEAMVNPRLAKKIAAKDTVKARPSSEKGNDDKKIPN
ncbi:outer membrane protein assembly factor BamD [Mucilaginibacter sp. BJC16-A38]|uniref:outer membrane protein assembly factor BamD n=1 Tax=Mucilaginibacter phenanthrenivorans TaxID=1234842 RepID=UPI0021577D35|nr:outer membrane protein assembly factor BamD [Mucilaginibacter phenanthrenivorans]MCR8558409.1 outer membrane protein assembly factor BamD [Mucilaginibacter phenanthrenivorans]